LVFFFVGHFELLAAAIKYEPVRENAS